MMSLRRNLAVLLLFLTPDSFLHFSSPLLPSPCLASAVPTSPPVTLKRILFDSNNDYEDNHSSPPSVSSSIKPTLLHESQPCKYNPCLEKQKSCAQLSAQNGCLCPGLSGPDQPPHAPYLQELVPVSDGDGRGKVEIQWCAPSSVVSGYRVVVEGSTTEALDFGQELRRGLVESLEVGATVCVEAVNKAGRSAPSDFSCKKYDPPESSNHALRVGVIGGGVAFLLILSMAAVILWKCQVCQKVKKDSTEGLGNPSYSTGGTL